MCLSSVREQYSSPSSFVMDGWKEFNGTKDKLKFQNYPVPGISTIPLDQWISADNSTSISASDGKSYELGFHVWLDEKTTSPRRRVFVRSVTAKGEQSGETCVIARELYVPSDPNGWPPKFDPEPTCPTCGSPTPAKKEGLLDKVKNSLKPGSC